MSKIIFYLKLSAKKIKKLWPRNSSWNYFLKLESQKKAYDEKLTFSESLLSVSLISSPSSSPSSKFYHVSNLEIFKSWTRMKTSIKPRKKTNLKCAKKNKNIFFVYSGCQRCGSGSAFIWVQGSGSWGIKQRKNLLKFIAFIADILLLRVNL